MTVEEIYSDREGFAKNVRAIAGPDVSKMGIRIISFVIQNITDNVSFNQMFILFCEGARFTVYILTGLYINNFVTSHDKSRSYSVTASELTVLIQ